MSNTVIAQFNERYEQVSAEAKDAFDKINTAVRGAISRAEASSTELFDSLVKTGEKRQKAQAKTGAKKSTKAEPTQLDQVRARVAQALGLPTRDEVEALNKKMATLTRKVNKLAKDAK
ncbi:MAG: phasin family protein [Pseudomonadales bacterium]|nr:phasin family protein [Pseudomonadales bacterium]